MMTKDEKHAHVANLIKIAKADRTLTPEEVIFIKSIAIKLEVSSSDFNQIVLNAEAVKDAVSYSSEVKMRQFYEMLTLMSIDGDADEHEEKICREVGTILGFNEEQVQRAIGLTKENLNKVVTPEQIAEVVG